MPITQLQVNKSASSIVGKCDEVLVGFPSDWYDVVKEIKQEAVWLKEQTTSKGEKTREKKS